MASPNFHLGGGVGEKLRVGKGLNSPERELSWSVQNRLYLDREHSEWEQLLSLGSGSLLWYGGRVSQACGLPQGAAVFSGTTLLSSGE